MYHQKTHKWSKEKRIKEGKRIKEMRDEELSWDVILSSYHITYNTGKALMNEYLESRKNDCQEEGN